MTTSICRWPECTNPKIHGRGFRYCEEHVEVALSTVRAKHHALQPPQSAERRRNHRLRKKYGLTTETFERLLASQGGRCANPGCRTDKPGERGWHVDHDHGCCPGQNTCGKCIRGILCGPCNWAAGYASDNATRLRGLAEYLEERSRSGLILGAYDFPSNAALIVACVRLGHLRQDALTLDPTFGLGSWWSLWRPDRLITHDRYTLDGVDFRHLPHADDEFEQITYDPPYVSVGGRETSGIPDFHERYGLRGAPKGHGRLQRLIDEGLDEMVRVLRPGTGRLLVKCANYVSGGQLRIGTHDTLAHALGAGLVVVDWFVHVGDPRPQPDERGPQQHARQNASTLYVMRKPRKRAKK